MESLEVPVVVETTVFIDAIKLGKSPHFHHGLLRQVMEERLQLEAVASGKVAASLTEHFLRPASSTHTQRTHKILSVYTYKYT